MTLKTVHKIIDSSELSSAEMAKICAIAADDKKASDIVILEVGKLTSYTDYFIICSAPSDRQVEAIARNVQDAMSERGVKAIGVEGLETSSWVLIDFGDTIFHCFTDAAREYYDLEGFWVDAPKLDYQ